MSVIVAIVIQMIFGVLAVSLESYPFLAAQIVAASAALGLMARGVIRARRVY